MRCTMLGKDKALKINAGFYRNSNDVCITSYSDESILKKGSSSLLEILLKAKEDHETSSSALNKDQLKINSGELNYIVNEMISCHERLSEDIIELLLSFSVLKSEYKDYFLESLASKTQTSKELLISADILISKMQEQTLSLTTAQSALDKLAEQVDVMSINDVINSNESDSYISSANACSNPDINRMCGDTSELIEAINSDFEEINDGLIHAV